VVLDVNDRGPARDHWISAEDVVRQVFSLETGGGIFPRQPMIAPPVVRVADRYITSTIELRGLEMRYVMEFVRCRFEYPPDLRQVAMGGLEFHGCHLPGLSARNLESKGDVVFDGSAVSGGAIDLTDASIGGSLTLRECHLDNPGGDSITAARIGIVGALLG
jgi:hypothetical protein